MESLSREWIEAAGAAWPQLVRHLGQATLFAAAVLAAVPLLARASTRLRQTLCLLASLKFLLPSALVLVAVAPLVPRLSAWTAELQALWSGWLAAWLGSGGPATPAASPADPTWTAALPAVALAVWLAGSLVLLGAWAHRQAAFARLVAVARRQAADPRVERVVERVGGELGLRRPVAVAAAPEFLQPAVWGIRRPVLMLPDGVVQHLSEEELEAVVLHELVHVRRRDNLVATLHRVLCCLFWFHPLVWLLDRRLLAEREHACDEQVVALTGRSEVYARSLLKVLGFGVGWRLAGVSSAAASNLKRRIERIRRSGAATLWPRSAHLALGFAAALGFCAVSLLAVAPGLVDEPRLLTVRAQERFCSSQAKRAGVELMSGSEAGDRCSKRGGDGETALVVPEAPPPRCS